MSKPMRSMDMILPSGELGSEEVLLFDFAAMATRAILTFDCPRRRFYRYDVVLCVGGY